MSFKSFINDAKHLVVEDDDSKPATSAKPATAAAPAPAFHFDMGATASSSSPFSVPGTTVLDENVYQRVLAKTDFDKTPVGTVIHKYFDALDGTPLDVNTKFKSAINQAGKLDGITSDKVLAAFDGLLVALQTEGDNFQHTVDAMTTREITARQQTLQNIADQIAAKQAEIAKLQEQHTTVSGELADAQGKVANATTQFGLATQRRSSEIAQQKAQFAGLLTH